MIDPTSPRSTDAPIHLAVETGGTKIVARLRVGNSNSSGRWPTTTPEQARRDILAFVGESLPDGRSVDGMGVAAFGPIVLEGRRAGELLDTPKPGWTGANLAEAVASALDCPFMVDTDVNAAALAEHAKMPEISSLAYLTVGTGIGGGLSFDGRTLRGAMHPEVGHLPLMRAPGDDLLSACPFHGECAEGLAAGPAVRHRLGAGVSLEQRPEVAALLADYIAQLIGSLTLAWSPDRIVLGGGVGTASGILDAVRIALPSVLGGYGTGDASRRVDYIVAPSLEHAGLAGAMVMAEAAAKNAG